MKRESFSQRTFSGMQVLLIALLFLSAIALTALIGCGKQSEDKLRVRSLELINDEGNVMASLTTEAQEWGGEREHVVSLELFDGDGKRRANLAVGAAGSNFQLLGKTERSQLNFFVGGHADVIQFINGDNWIVFGGDPGTITAISHEKGKERAIQLSLVGEPQIRTMQKGVWQTGLPVPK